MLNPPMQYSQIGQDLTKSFEACRLVAYQDSVGVWTIGWGHTGPEVVKGLTCDQMAADNWFQQDFAWAVDAVNTKTNVVLQQGEFDALVDFTFNLGAGAFAGSTMLRDLNAGNYEAAAAQIEVWDRAGGVVLAGLLRRRVAEHDMFVAAQDSTTSSTLLLSSQQ